MSQVLPMGGTEYFKDKTVDEPAETKNFYDALGVSKDVSKSELRKAYSKLILKAHPDRGGDAKEFDKIQLAYETLIDPRQRRTYDKYGEKWLEAKSEDFLLRAFTGVDTPESKGPNMEEQFVSMERRNAELEKKVILYEREREETHTSGFESWLRNRKDGMTMSINTSNIMEAMPDIEVVGDKTPLPPMKVPTAMMPTESGGNIEMKEFELQETLKPNEVFVRWLAAPVTPADIEASRHANKPGTVGGMHAVGFAEKVGADVLTIPPGALVVPRLPVGAGTFRPVCVLPQHKLHSLNATEAKDETLAFLPVFCQAYQLLNVEVLKPGDYVLQSDAMTPVGQAVIQICKILRIGTINIIPDSDAFDTVKHTLLKLGATHVIRSTPSAGREIGVLGAPEPRLCLACSDSLAVATMFDVVRPDNTVCLYGDVLGTLEKSTIPAATIISRGVKLTGFSYMKWCEHNRAEHAHIMDVVLGLMEEDRLQMEFELLESFDQFTQAFQRAKGNVAGICSPALLRYAGRDEVKEAAEKDAIKDKSMQEVYNWLNEVNMADLAGKFNKAGYNDLESIKAVGLTDEDLDYIGITPPVLRRRLIAHSKVKAPDAAVAAAAPSDDQ